MLTSLKNTGRFRPEKQNRNNFKPRNFDQEASSDSGRLNLINENIRIDSLYGFHKFNDLKERIGFLINMHTTELCEDDKRLTSGIDYYFIEEGGGRFKVSYPYFPYFFVRCRKNTHQEVSLFLNKKYNELLHKVTAENKEDLNLPNHLTGIKQKYLKLTFLNTVDLMKVKRDIMQAVKANKEREKSQSEYTNLLSNALNPNRHQEEERKIIDHMDNILDIREYDVPHHVRVSIDTQVFCGGWYSVRVRGTEPPLIVRREDIIEPPEPIVLAYDIETTKLPLKFPDAATDQIIMISYMIDGQGYLITNREIISSDIADFEYTPKPEFEGLFEVFNEPNEKLTIKKFFDHINEIKPHIFVTYNGDFFDWPFVETRAAVHNMDMKEKIGFAKNRDGTYCSRPAIHMDCFAWVKRDSYLPVGSQGLKAVAKAKLRYDPVELDPEDMCRMASEDPETLSNYSVSDAVATFYLYQKYVHPFIFALCTIIPLEPDEVLRKGSGTLCECLLMVQAFQANVIFPNKQEEVFNKLTKEGHLLDQETYVGGHVEALESGVFRADIPCRFKIVPTAVDKLIDGIEDTLKYAIQEEEKVPLEMVTDFDEVVGQIKEKLLSLRSQPLRLENPVIYHLDVAAMYPNIILTNRLQPSAMVNETICAACDYNKPNALCQKKMEWVWRGEYLTGTLSEYQRIQQQLETEKFPSFFPNGPRRAFHELSKKEQATFEKKRLSDYCKKVYKKAKVTKTEVRTQTICQKENSFYVDTVRAFRDRRYEYKALNKAAKQQVAAAVKKGDPADVKSAKSREVLYDSLQLAHKCILNSFYGYVMRKGSRWFSMEMGGVVCYTGAHIIMKAREIIEQIGRPLELDTDGIWCILPASFPDNFIISTNHPKKSKINLSYPNAVLNLMVREAFTNEAYHELIDSDNMMYEIKNENSIFFEVDGPYLAMILPAAREEGKKLKKRYAVFNFDGSLAELKGFEVKRRGELQLIKIFQSSVFDSFLKGSNLQECYASVAKDADYWLDVLYSKGADLPDSELFELISENKSMSRKLEDYGSQKSTSISTAKRLAEFLGDQMVKDKGLACKYIIANKPHGAPVTERAIPLAIFQSEPSIKQHYLRKWLKDPGLQSDDIRELLDWNYYIERLGNSIQKIITIPAAMQGVQNPVPRIKHPDWLHKRVMERNAPQKQQSISSFFNKIERPKADEDTDEIRDIEDTAGPSNSDMIIRPLPVVHKRKRDIIEPVDDNEINKSWREVLGHPPPMGDTDEAYLKWLDFQKQKWEFQRKQRVLHRPNKKSKIASGTSTSRGIVRDSNPKTMTGFLRKAHRKLLDYPWEIIQLSSTNEPGMFRLWVLVGQDLHQLRLVVPRIFYVNVRKPRNNEEKKSIKKCVKILPRSRPVYNLYQYTIPESHYEKVSQGFNMDLYNPDMEGIYETQVSLEFRAILELGCVCQVDTEAYDMKDGGETFNLKQLKPLNIHSQPYLKSWSSLNRIFLYHHWSSNHQRAIWGLFLVPDKRAHIFVLDTVASNQMPNMNSLYVQLRNALIQDNGESCIETSPETIEFSIKIETRYQQICRSLQAALTIYQNDHNSGTVLVIQTPLDRATLVSDMPLVNDFPIISTHIQDPINLYSTLEWQKVGSRVMIRNYLKSEKIINTFIEQSRFFQAPIGNIPADSILFSSDLFYARQLQQHNFVLWCSSTDKPDLGGSENDDNRLLTDFEDSTSCAINNPGSYSSVCVELNIQSLAVNTMLQYHHIHDIDGTSAYVAFDNAPQTSLQDIVTGESTNTVSSYDESRACNPAFKVLKSLINAWLRDVALYKNKYADFQLIHFYRWLRSPDSLLYDPALRRILHNYMKKLFIQLIAEFKRLGSIIVYANFNKIILCTKKRMVSDALGYTDFVVQAIQNGELYHSVEMVFEQCWEYLIWLDLHNHAGIKGKVTNSDETMTESQEENEDDTPEIIMNWNLKNYLPSESACQESFNRIIAGYIVAVYEYMRRNEQSNSGTPRVRRLSTSQSLTAPLGLGALENTAEFAQKFISGELSQKFFLIIEKIHKKLPNKVLTFNEYPDFDLDGKDDKEITPALELIKCVCQVLSLDKAIEDEVSNLKTNAMRIISVSSFSAKAEWKDPCNSLILTEVMCKNCDHTRDIDLCKDNSFDIENNRHRWLCPVCKGSYSNAEIEFSLIDIVERKSMAYVIQDIQCKKCYQINRENMNENCSCAGQFQTLINRQDLIKFMKVCSSIAKKCGMKLLSEVIENTKLL